MLSRKRFKSISAICCMAILLVASTVVASFADTPKIYKTTNQSQSFANDWARTVKSGNATMKYGFDTFLVNEDFTEGIHKTMKCTVWVNDLTVWEKSSASANKKAKADISHKTGRGFRNYSMDW